MPVVKDVVIAMPAYDNKTEFEISDAITNAINDPECPVSGRILYSGDSLVSRARNECAFQFENLPVDKARYLLFVDSDIHFKPSDVTRLRSHNMPVVAGLYFFKNLNCLPVLNNPIGGSSGDLQRVREIGTGFLMIRRDVFAGLKAMGIAKTYKPGANQYLLDQRRTEYFPVGVMDDYLQSEDYAFCRMCEQINIPIYADTKVLLGHKGQCLFPLKPHALVPALTAALKSFRDLPAHEQVTEQMVKDLGEALNLYNQRNAPVLVAKAEEAKEIEYEVTHVSKGEQIQPEADGRKLTPQEIEEWTARNHELRNLIKRKEELDSSISSLTENVGDDEIKRITLMYDEIQEFLKGSELYNRGKNDKTIQPETTTPAPTSDARGGA